MACLRANVIEPKTKRALLPNAVDGTPTWHRYTESRKIRVKVPVIGGDKLNTNTVAAALKKYEQELKDADRSVDDCDAEAVRTEKREHRAFSKLMTALTGIDKGIEDDGEGVREWRTEVALGHFYQCEQTKTERQWGADSVHGAS